MCPLCLSLVASNERGLIAHLLAGHPGEARTLGLLLTLANLAGARRPATVFLLDLAILGVAVLLSRAPGRGWR
jgi:hypothetical protein